MNNASLAHRLNDSFYLCTFCVLFFNNQQNGMNNASLANQLNDSFYLCTFCHFLKLPVKLNEYREFSTSAERFVLVMYILYPIFQLPAKWSVLRVFCTSDKRFILVRYVQFVSYFFNYNQNEME